MRFLYVAPIGARNFACCFSINITLLRSLKALILLGFMKKPTLVSFVKGELDDELTLLPFFNDYIILFLTFTIALLQTIEAYFLSRIEVYLMNFFGINLSILPANIKDMLFSSKLS
jgi:hypothetical protein